jgi:hypothetical protein
MEMSRRFFKRELQSMSPPIVDQAAIRDIIRSRRDHDVDATVEGVDATVEGVDAAVEGVDATVESVDAAVEPSDSDHDRIATMLCAAIKDGRAHVTLFGREMRIDHRKHGAGTFGSTRLVCDVASGQCVYIVKLVPLIDPSARTPAPRNYVSKRHFEIEAYTLKVASDAGVSPRFYGSIICDGVGVLLMDRAHMLLSDVDMSTDAQRQIIANNVYKVVDRMHDAGIYHQDLHSRNVMINADWSINIIDFGKAITLDQPVPPFLRACDLARLYYEFSHKSGDWDHSITMCGMNIPMPPPIQPGGPRIPQAAIAAVVCETRDIYFEDGITCPRNKTTYPYVHMQSELVYEELASVPGFRTFLHDVYDPSRSGFGVFGPFISMYASRPVSKARCMQVVWNVYNGVPIDTPISYGSDHMPIQQDLQ